MVRFFTKVLLIAVLPLLAACSDPKFLTYNGPEVTQVLVKKSERKMYLIHKKQALKVYDIGLGFAPEGHKEQSGDGRTPEGLYFIDRRNPDSRFHLSLGISYPNKRDFARARSMGVSPGGDIFIHGRPKRWQNGEQDWTWGCIAVTDPEMEEVYAMVKTGTPILITP